MESLGFLSYSLTSPDGGADTKSTVVVPEAMVTASHTQPKTQGVLLFLKYFDCLYWKLLICPEGCQRQGPAAGPAQGFMATERDGSANMAGIMFSNVLVLYINIF